MVCLSFLDVLGTVPSSLRVVLTSFEHRVTDIKHRCCGNYSARMPFLQSRHEMVSHFEWKCVQNLSKPLAMNSERSPKRLESSNNPCWTFIRTNFYIDYFIPGKHYMLVCLLDLDSPTQYSVKYKGNEVGLTQDTAYFLKQSLVSIGHMLSGVKRRSGVPNQTSLPRAVSL